MAVADRLRLKRPGLGVLLLRHKVGTDLLTSAIRAGIREVLTIGDHESLRIAVERTRETFNAIHGPTASDANDGRVITVFSPKGGVGKTTVAVNLALALSDNGANRVCLVDLDLAFGDVAITLQLIPEHTISEAVEVEDHLDMSMLSDLLTRHDSGLHVLAAPTHPDAKDRISTKLVRRVLAALRTNFDYIVVDTSPGFDEQVLSAFDETDECVVVATLDVPTVKNVKMSMETLDLLNLATGHRYLVLNRADDEVGLTPANVETILKMGVTVQFPSSMDVANATNHGRPIVLSKPDHRVSRAIRELGRRLSTEDIVCRHPQPCRTRRSAACSVADAWRSHEHPNTPLASLLPRRGPRMSSLSDRLAAARGEDAPATNGADKTSVPPTPAPAATNGASATPPTNGKGPSGSGSGAGTTQEGEPVRSRNAPAPAKGRFDDLKASVHNELLIQLGPQLYDSNLTQEDLESSVRGVLQDVMANSDRPLTATDRSRITQEIADDILGYGPLEPYLRDKDVSEVMVNGPFDIWLEHSGRLTKVNGRFNDEAHLRRTIDKIVSRIGRRVDESSPMVDARLPDGSRVNAVVPPLAIDGSSLTIRKFAADPLTVDNLVDFGSLTPRAAAFLDACVRGRLNVIVSGGTGAGKTTTLNVLSSFIPVGRAHRHHRGRRGAPAQAGPRGAARVPPVEHRGQGRGHDPRPGEELAAHATRPDHRRRGPRRLCAGHAAGHEHRSRRLHLHAPLERAARHAVAHGDHGADGRHGPADPGDPRAGGLRGRPGRAPGPAQGRLAPDHAHHRGGADGGRRDRPAGHLPLRHRRRLRRARQGDGHAEVHRSAAQVPGEDGEQCRHRGPDDVRNGRTAMSEPRAGRGTWRSAVAVAAAALLSGALDRHRRHRLRGRHRHHRPCQARRRPAPDPLLGAGHGPVDLASAAVQIDGKDVTATAQNAADSDLRRTSVLAFDTSNSMAGAKFTQAKAAALSYLDAVPDNVYVGMVTFDDSVDVAREPTLDRDDMRATIRSLRLAESTSLNQGVMEAVARPASAAAGTFSCSRTAGTRPGRR